jgi:AbrB family looped-hinge helix DNA binding protein
MGELYSGRIDSQGRLAIPAEVRDRLGLKAGDEVTVELRADDARPPRYSEEALRRHEEAIDRLQQLARKHIPRDVSLVDELIAERRAEAAREAEQG